MTYAPYVDRTTNDAEEDKMKTKNIAHTALYIGAGAGILVFALAGLLPSVFIGGVIGLKIATFLFGAPLGVALLPRIIVGAFMVLGITVAATVFTIGGSLLGWLFGTVVDHVRAGRAVDLTPKQTKA